MSKFHKPQKKKYKRQRIRELGQKNGFKNIVVSGASNDAMMSNCTKVDEAKFVSFLN